MSMLCFVPMGHKESNPNFSLGKPSIVEVNSKHIIDIYIVCSKTEPSLSDYYLPAKYTKNKIEHEEGSDDDQGNEVKAIERAA